MKCEIHVLQITRTLDETHHHQFSGDWNPFHLFLECLVTVDALSDGDKHKYCYYRCRYRYYIRLMEVREEVSVGLETENQSTSINYEGNSKSKIEKNKYYTNITTI